MTIDQRSGYDRQPSRHTLSRRGLAIGLGLTLAGANQVDISTVLAQCIGPDVPCPTPDGIDRKAYAEVFRYVKNGGYDYAISDAAVRLYVIRATGTSDYPELDKQHPKLGSDGLPIAFLDEKPKIHVWRDVEKQILFVSAQPGDPNFNGRLINSETGQTRTDIFRGGDEIKDRFAAKIRGGDPCDNCELNCGQVVVWERTRGASNPDPFKEKATGLYQRYDEGLFLWPLDERNPSVHNLESWTEVPDNELRFLLANRQVAKTSVPAVIKLKPVIEAVR